MRPRSPCGLCDHPKETHGRRYHTLSGYHEWVPARYWHPAYRPRTTRTITHL